MTVLNRKKELKTIILTLIPVLAFLGILGIVILFGNWSQPQPELGGGAIDLDPDLAPSYALDFVSGLFYHTVVPLMGLTVGVSALFLVPHFILKRKNIPSRPYMSLILAGLLLYFVMPHLISTLESFGIIFYSSPQQAIRWIFDIRFVLQLIPFGVLFIAGILLYRSSVLRKLIRK